MTEIVDQQKKFPINIPEFSLFADNVVRAVREAQNRHPVIAFIDDQEMTRLNQEFRNNIGTTDVLSFRYQEEEFEKAESLGDIVISAEQAYRQATEHELEPGQEIRQLILHGILHLCGYDHETDEGEMNARELELRKDLGIDF